MLNPLPLPNGKLIAHRGAPLLAPENTLAAFKKAHALGYNWVEFDVQQCATGEWVVIHDETLDRTTNGQGKVSDTPKHILQTLDAGSWFNESFKEEKIPMLSDLLHELAAFGMHPNIEVKFTAKTHQSLPHQSSLQNAATSLLDCLQQHWTLSTPPLISSFNQDFLATLKLLNPNLPLGLLVDDLNEAAIEQMITLQYFSLHCDYKLTPKSMFKKAQTHKIPILLYTLNAKEDILHWLKDGATALFSELPYPIP